MATAKKTERDRRAPVPAISRIVVTFAGAEEPSALVEAAALTARALGAKLHGLYIREAALSHLAALPFSAAVGPGGARPGAVTVSTVERAWRREERACRYVLQMAGGSTVWTFDSVTGEFEDCLCSVAAPGDLVVLAGHPAEMAPQRLSAAVQAAARVAGAVMVAGARRRRAASSAGPVLAISRAGAAADMALGLAARLAEAAGRRISFLTPADSEPEVPAMSGAALAGRHVERHLLAFWTERDLRAAIDRIGPSLVVADLRAAGCAHPALTEQFFQTVGAPMILLDLPREAESG